MTTSYEGGPGSSSIRLFPRSGSHDPIRHRARIGACRPLRVSPTNDIRQLADEEVMPLVQRGDPRAFELLYDRHGGAAFSLAFRMMGSRAAAEDVSQEAFL